MIVNKEHISSRGQTLESEVKKDYIKSLKCGMNSKRTRFDWSHLNSYF